MISIASSLTLSPSSRSSGGGGGVPAPTGFNVTGAAETIITLEWTLAVDPTAFTLEYKVDGDTIWSGWGDVVASDRSATITGLLPGQLYQFRLKADTSAWVTTSGSTDAVEPAVFVLVTSGTDTVEIYWSRSQDPETFAVSYRTAPLVGAPGSWLEGPSVMASNRSCSFDSLDSDTRYEFRIVATVSSVDSAPMITPQYTKPETPTGLSLTGSEAGAVVNLTYSAGGATCECTIYLDGSIIYDGTSNADSVTVPGSYTTGQTLGGYVARLPTDPSGLNSTEAYIGGFIDG